MGGNVTLDASAIKSFSKHDLIRLYDKFRKEIISRIKVNKNTERKVTKCTWKC